MGPSASISPRNTVVLERTVRAARRALIVFGFSLLTIKTFGTNNTCSIKKDYANTLATVGGGSQLKYHFFAIGRQQKTIALIEGARECLNTRLRK